ncbi:SinI family restriction endonuclease [Prochlorothrix hollandica]|uniref:SinI family restriction endonuclease n=1 Tax=Prochlorothrix hollandica TaxID=1223 RepID=UPI003341B2CF
MSIIFRDLVESFETTEELLEFFEFIVSAEQEQLSDSHKVILNACHKNPELSPGLRSPIKDNLVVLWLNKYKKGLQNRISSRISKKPQTVSDPVIKTIISTRLEYLSAQDLDKIIGAHRLSMSAENILGLLLEEFLATKLYQYGWHCCWGEVLRHVDFCHQDGSLLQVKNRSNSENSSSSRVRINQPIEKWHRVDARTGLCQWSLFNERFNVDDFSEISFVSFIQDILSKNPQALAIEDDNIWLRE